VAGITGQSNRAISGFLQGLREYRRALSGPSQALLDALVAAGLDRTPHQAPADEIQLFERAYAATLQGERDQLATLNSADATSWERTTPWGQACRARYGYPGPGESTCD
jgi:hypothetical protein